MLRAVGRAGDAKCHRCQDANVIRKQRASCNVPVHMSDVASLVAVQKQRIEHPNIHHLTQRMARRQGIKMCFRMARRQGIKMSSDGPATGYQNVSSDGPATRYQNASSDGPATRYQNVSSPSCQSMVPRAQ